MEDYTNIDSIMASLENLRFDDIKPKKSEQNQNKLQDTLELEFMVKKIDNEMNISEAKMNISSVSSLKSKKSKSPILIIPPADSIQSPQASINQSSIQEEEKKENKVLKQNSEVDEIIAEISMKDFYEANINGEDHEEPNFSEMTSEEIISWYIKRYTQYKNTVVRDIPQEHRVRAKALKDLKPMTSFPFEQAQTILEFKFEEVIIILGVIDEEWLIGYRENDPRQLIKIMPASFLRLEFYYLPFPTRNYEIKNWEMFGSSKDEIIKKDPPYFPREKLAFKSKTESPMRKETLAKPKILCRALRNFNLQNYKPYIFADVPAISFERDQLVVITKLPNRINWCEGYPLYTEDIEIGLFPYEFVTPIYLNLK